MATAALSGTWREVPSAQFEQLLPGVSCHTCPNANPMDVRDFHILKEAFAQVCRPGPWGWLCEAISGTCWVGGGGWAGSIFLAPLKPPRLNSVRPQTQTPVSSGVVGTTAAQPQSSLTFQLNLVAYVKRPNSSDILFCTENYKRRNRRSQEEAPPEAELGSGARL